MHVRAVCFGEQKTGDSPADWEDGCGYDEGNAGAPPRFIVLDGATDALDSQAWVRALIGDFLTTEPGVARPVVGVEGMHAWFTDAQARWQRVGLSESANPVEEYRFHTVGSFATMVCGEFLDLDGPTPRWVACALGDTVLFHVRGQRLVHTFPPVRAGGFGLVPHVFSSLPAALPMMGKGLRTDRGEVRAGDLVYVATDALADWMLGRAHSEELWAALYAIGHDHDFTRLVRDQRAAGALKEDDVALLRMEVTDQPTEDVVVCP